MDLLSFILGGAVGFLIRPAHCFYMNYQWHRGAWKKSITQSLRMAFKDIWS